MSFFSSSWTTALAGALCTLPAYCQSAPPLKPTESVAAVHQAPTLSYTSTFAKYQPFGEAALVPWRKANEAVYKAGGWRAYAKESQAPVEAPAPVAPAPVAPAQTLTTAPSSNPTVAAPAAAAGAKP